MKNVVIVISDGFEEIETVTIIDVLRRANINVKIVAIKTILTSGAHNIKIQADEILRLKNTLNKILSKNTKKSLKKIEKDTDRNFFMSSEEAKAYGLIDTILSERK